VVGGTYVAAGASRRRAEALRSCPSLWQMISNSNPTHFALVLSFND
jgi:hypothetical protein